MEYIFWKEPEYIRGIQFIPITAGMLYLGYDLSYAQKNYEHMITQNGGTENAEDWYGVIWEFQSLFNSNSVISKYSELVNIETETDDIIVYPNPCHLSKGEVVHFLNIPNGSTIKIYDIQGVLIYEGNYNFWEGKNNSGKSVSSGIYIWVINVENSTRKGKIAIIK